MLWPFTSRVALAFALVVHASCASSSSFCVPRSNHTCFGELHHFVDADTLNQPSIMGDRFSPGGIRG